MFKRAIALVLIAAGIFAPLHATAIDRWYAARRVAGYGIAGRAMYGYGAGYGYGGYGGVGTAFSAADHGRADIIRSQGMYNQMNSQAMVNYEEARSKYIDNQEKWTHVYLERRRASEAEFAKAQAERIAARERSKEFQANNPPRSPTVLASSQLDPSTGRITWPTGLTSEAFTDLRKSLDSLFELRTHTSTTDDITTQIRKKADEMRDLLRTQIRQMPTQDYLEARRFLDALVVTAQSA